jgi:serine/threonine-protein kinase
MTVTNRPSGASDGGGLTMRTCPRCSSLYVNDVLCCGLDGERLVDVDRDPLLGTTLDRYRIQATLGQGGMARVYRAQHAHLGHAVALKVLHGDTASDRRRVERFRREAASAAQLHHPNVVQVHDFGVSPDGLVFMAMELLEGATLAQRLEEGRRFSPSEIAELVRQVALGLGSAHRLGFVHRDLNPKNLMLVDGPRGLRVVILDFGLVRMLDSADPRLTVHGQVYGTPAYMAPEQIVDGELDARTDLYALGVILYELLAGRRPFAGSMGDVLDKHTRGRAAPLDDRTGLGALALTLMAKTPAERPASTEAVVAALEALGLVRSTTTSSVPARAPADRAPAVASLTRTPARAAATPAAEASPSRAGTTPEDEALPTVVLNAIEALDAQSLLADARHEAATWVPVATPAPRRPSYPTEVATPPSVARAAPEVAAVEPPAPRAPEPRAPSLLVAPPRAAVFGPPRATSVRRTARPTRVHTSAAPMAPERPELDTPAAPSIASSSLASSSPPAPMASPSLTATAAEAPSRVRTVAPSAEAPRDAELLAPVAVVAVAASPSSSVAVRAAVDEVTTPIRLARRARKVSRPSAPVESGAETAEDPELAAMMANAKPAWPALAVTSGLFALGAVFAYPWLLGARSVREAEAPAAVVSAAPTPSSAPSGLVGVVPAVAGRAAASSARAAATPASPRAAAAQPGARALPADARASTRGEAAAPAPEVGPARGASKLLPRLPRRASSATPADGTSVSAADPDEPDERPAVAPAPSRPVPAAPADVTPPIGGPSAAAPSPLVSPLVAAPSPLVSPLVAAPSPLLPAVLAEASLPSVPLAEAPAPAPAPSPAVAEAPTVAPTAVVSPAVPDAPSVAPAAQALAPSAQAPAPAPIEPAPVTPSPVPPSLAPPVEAAPAPAVQAPGPTPPTPPMAPLPEAALPEVVLPPSGALPAVELPLSELVPVESDLPLELVRAALQSPIVSPASAEVLTSTTTR